MMKFHGAYVAIVTPFINGRLDEKGLVDLIEFQIANGTHGIVPCGTTGESATLDFAEHKRVIELTVQKVAGRVPVIAGTGANNTIEAIELTESARESGADAVLSVTPYYNKPNAEGDSTSISRPLPRQSISRCSSTMSLVGPPSTCCPIP